MLTNIRLAITKFFPFNKDILLISLYDFPKTKKSIPRGLHDFTLFSSSRNAEHVCIIVPVTMVVPPLQYDFRESVLGW